MKKIIAAASFLVSVACVQAQAAEKREEFPVPLGVAVRVANAEPVDGFNAKFAEGQTCFSVGGKFVIHTRVLDKAVVKFIGDGLPYSSLDCPKEGIVSIVEYKSLVEIRDKMARDSDAAFTQEMIRRKR